jgi:hypothetical protein
MHMACLLCLQIQKYYRSEEESLKFFYWIFKVLASLLLYMLPFNFPCDAGFWDRTHGCFDLGIGSRSTVDALTIRLGLIHIRLDLIQILPDRIENSTRSGPL